MKLTFKLTKETNLKEIANNEILSKKEGKISFNWYLEQCGNLIWWTCKGYIGNEPITIKVSNY